MRRAARAVGGLLIYIGTNVLMHCLIPYVRAAVGESDD